MTLPEFVQQFTSALDIDGVTVDAETQFKQMPTWDSLCVLNVIAMVDEAYGLTLTAQHIEDASTVADLYATIERIRA